jgi:hypothetical protein
MQDTFSYQPSSDNPNLFGRHVLQGFAQRLALDQLLVVVF